MYIMNTTLSATEARNRFFELLDRAIYRNEEFTIEKGGKPAVKITPAVTKRSPKEIAKILAEFRKTFSKAAKRKYWSVLDTPAFKKRERKYRENLRKGIVD